MNWDIGQLKHRAIAILQKNYWWFVLIGIILTFINGEGLGITNTYDVNDNPQEILKMLEEDSISDEYNLDDYYDDYDDDYDDYDDYDEESSSSFPWNAVLRGATYTLAAIVMLAAIAGCCIKIFLLNPLVIGVRRYLMLAREDRASMNELGFAFQSGRYLNVVKIMFLRDLKNCLWFLLFLIPGIVKAYEYQMIPYILSENPMMDSKRAFELTRQMTYGEKGSMFLLDLSFIGWNILSGLTCGIVGIFWTTPYYEATYSELYAALRQKARNMGHTNQMELPEYRDDCGYGYNPNSGNGYGSNNGYNQNPGNGYGSNNGYNQNPGNGYGSNNGYNQNPGNGYGSNNGYNQNQGNGYSQGAENPVNLNKNGNSNNGWENNQQGQSGAGYSNSNQFGTPWNNDNQNNTQDK